MASTAQALANRANAQSSTGPQTQAGKLASSRNATRHGLTGAQIIMPGEDAEAYEELRNGLHQAHRPVNDPERLLVDQIAANAWRLMRAQRVEAAVLTKIVEGADDPDAALATAFLERPKDLAKIQRYVIAAERAYYKAMKELANVQKDRQAFEEEEGALDGGIGFVSYGDSETSGGLSEYGVNSIPPARIATPEATARV